MERGVVRVAAVVVLVLLMVGDFSTVLSPVLQMMGVPSDSGASKAQTVRTGRDESGEDEETHAMDSIGNTVCPKGTGTIGDEIYVKFSEIYSHDFLGINKGVFLCCNWKRDKGKLKLLSGKVWKALLRANVVLSVIRSSLDNTDGIGCLICTGI